MILQTLLTMRSMQCWKRCPRDLPRATRQLHSARKLANLLVRARRELDADELSTPYTTMPSTSIESLIVIDRDIDFATPLLTQLTYEGLIDEFVGVKNNKAEVDSTILGPASQSRPSQAGISSTSGAAATPARQSLKQTIQLDSSDSLYAQLRSSNFAYHYTVHPSYQHNKSCSQGSFG